MKIDTPTRKAPQSRISDHFPEIGKMVERRLVPVQKKAVAMPNGWEAA